MSLLVKAGGVYPRAAWRYGEHLRDWLRDAVMWWRGWAGGLSRAIYSIPEITLGSVSVDRYAVSHASAARLKFCLCKLLSDSAC